MARHTEVVLLLIVATAATGLATVVPLSDAYFDKIVQEAEHRRVNGRCSQCCQFGWVQYNRHCFIYKATQMTWAFAEEHCMDLGGHLMSIHNENDYRLAKSLIRTHDPKQNPTWIGLSSCQEHGKWFWSDGTRLAFTKWNLREPNNLNGECCVHMNHSREKNWNDVPCNIKHPFVCAKKLK
ncbi:lactose-binding lectin l-2-like [Neoarius graeffei]|uniref:lactose-binding lectin l-2-like n=1 Tax=Neoarius graeffei TaxID=443677 RepID=UPI00298D54F7|nr:lactose-binding lectin l-2-like [Neoarius graeffei]